MKPSTSSTAIGSLKPASPSSVRSSRRRSPEPRSSENTAAPSVEATIDPSSSPSTVVNPNSQDAARPVTTAVITRADDRERDGRPQHGPDLATSRP